MGNAGKGDEKTTHSSQFTRLILAETTLCGLESGPPEMAQTVHTQIQDTNVGVFIK